MSNLEAQEDAGQETDFPWHLGVYDAHCHPTDTASSISRIPHMKTRALTIMATRSQDQELVANFAEQPRFTRESVQGGFGDRCVLPAFGWHPWFSHHIYIDLPSIHGVTQDHPSKEAHYQEVLSPPLHDAKFLESLPDPRPLSALLKELRAHLEQFPQSLVGEVGLDRSFRVPGTDILHDDPSLTPGGRQGKRLSPHHVIMSHQRKLLISQLNLAGEMQRAVSVHGVAAHGAVYDAIRETWRDHEWQAPSKRGKRRQAEMNPGNEVEESKGNRKELRSPLLSFPPRLCLHSFSGTTDTLRQYLHPSVPVRIFFSFSTLVNFSSSTAKVLDVIKMIPQDRILVESDFHAAGKDMDDLVEDIVRKICHIRGWSLAIGVNQLASNWMHFVFGNTDD